MNNDTSLKGTDWKIIAALKQFGKGITRTTVIPLRAAVLNDGSLAAHRGQM